MLSDKTLKRMNAYVANLDAKISKTAGNLAPKNKTVTASNLKQMIASLREDAKNISKVYAGLRKVMSSKVAYTKASKSVAMSKMISDIAVVATKIDLIMAVAEAEMKDQVDTENLEPEDILSDLSSDTGVDLEADDGDDEFETPEEEEEETPEEEATETEADAYGDDSVPASDEKEYGIDVNAEDEFDPSELFPEEEEEEKPAPVAKKAKTTLKANAKATTTVKANATSTREPLFNFMA